MARNKVVRSPNPGVGQGKKRAVSQATGWQYEHDETNAQINAIEKLIGQVRTESGAATDNDGRDEDGFPLRGATFSWGRDEGGNVVIGTMYVADSDDPASVVSPGGDFPAVEGKAWVTETWSIARDGTVSEG